MQPIAYDHLDKIEAILIPATNADTDNLANGKTDCNHYAMLPTSALVSPKAVRAGGRSARHHEDNREGEAT